MKNIPLIDEDIIEQAFAPGFTPDKEIDEKIKAQIEEKIYMMKRKHALRVAMIAAVLTLTLSATCLAAYHLLTAGDAAKEMRLPELEQAFQSENAVFINEAKTAGEFKYTLLGITHGENLFGFETYTGFTDSQNYAIFAIEHADGSKFIPMSEPNGKSMEEFLASMSEEEKKQSDVIANIRPMFVANGRDIFEFIEITWAADVVDGILYLAVEYDRLEDFEDNGVHILMSYAWSDYSDLSMESGVLEVKDSFPGAVFTVSQPKGNLE